MDCRRRWGWSPSAVPVSARIQWTEQMRFGPENWDRALRRAVQVADGRGIPTETASVL
jgi:hypothetical protein